MTWVSLPIEELYDCNGHRARRTSRDEDAVLAISDGDVNLVRDHHGNDIAAVFCDDGGSKYWLPCDEDGEYLPDADPIDVEAVRV